MVLFLSMKVRSGKDVTVGGVPLPDDFAIPGCKGAVYAFESREAARAFDPEAELVPVTYTTPRRRGGKSRATAGRGSDAL